MAKGKSTKGKDYYARQYAITERNLKKKGKTNKKRHHAGYIAHVK